MCCGHTFLEVAIDAWYLGLKLFMAALGLLGAAGVYWTWREVSEYPETAPLAVMMLGMCFAIVGMVVFPFLYDAGWLCPLGKDC